MKLWNESSLCYLSVFYQVGRLILDGENCGRLSFSSVWSKAVLKKKTHLPEQSKEAQRD